MKALQEVLADSGESAGWCDKVKAILSAAAEEDVEMEAEQAAADHAGSEECQVAVIDTVMLRIAQIEAEGATDDALKQATQER